VTVEYKRILTCTNQLKIFLGEKFDFSEKKLGNKISYKDVEIYETSSNETFMYLAKKDFFTLTNNL